MLLTDYLLSQQDRHYSNLATIGDRVYPLYDNGECLGIGAIGMYSQKFREHTESLNEDYLKSLLGMPRENFLNHYGSIKHHNMVQYNRIVNDNFRRLFG